MFTWPQYRKIRQRDFGETKTQALRKYMKEYLPHHRKQKEKMHLQRNLEYIEQMKCEMFDLVCNPPVVDTGHSHGYSLAPCKEAPKYPYGIPCKKQEEENLMNYASASVIATPQTTEIQDQRKYLAKRLDEVYHTLRDPLESKFGLIDDDAPAGPKELAERLAAGKFIIRGHGDDAKNADRYRYWGASDLIQWRDPAKKADQDGFEAARTELKAKKQAALDIIKIDEPKAGLEAIKALEAWEPTGATN